MWEVLDFTEGSQNLIGDWLRSHTDVDDVEARLDTRLNYMRAEPNQAAWPIDYSGSMTGPEWSGIRYIRFRIDKVRYRVFYYFGPRRRDITLLMGWDKRGGAKLRKSDANEVQRRRTLIGGDRKYGRPHFS